MRYSHILGKTIREAPSEEVALNAQLLLRAGYIDKLMAGSYTLLHLGKRVQQKIELIVREEMNATGSQEILMPLLHPKEIWNETGRWDSADEIMYKLEKGDREFVLSFTHEEIFMDLIRKHTSSYKDFPVSAYHFSTKFRSELRAKSGILRGREFIMKDMYSVHTSEEDLMEYYEKVVEAYMRVFARVGLEVHKTQASGGVFTTRHTHEFQLITPVGEDLIYFSDAWEGAKNEEVMTDEDRQAPNLREEKSIEVGNIFPLGTFYSEKMGAYFVDSDGSRKPLWYGSYGIGITRLIGALVEMHHDKDGIKWPTGVAPYQVQLVEIQGGDDTVRTRAEELYHDLLEAGVEVLWDDRGDATAGAKFADADLIGLPLRVVVSSRNVDTLEVKKRGDAAVEMVPREKIVESVQALL